MASIAVASGFSALAATPNTFPEFIVSIPRLAPTRGLLSLTAFACDKSVGSLNQIAEYQKSCVALKDLGADLSLIKIYSRRYVGTELADLRLAVVAFATSTGRVMGSQAVDPLELKLVEENNLVLKKSDGSAYSTITASVSFSPAAAEYKEFSLPDRSLQTHNISRLNEVDASTLQVRDALNLYNLYSANPNLRIWDELSDANQRMSASSVDQAKPALQKIKETHSAEALNTFAKNYRATVKSTAQKAETLIAEQNAEAARQATEMRKAQAAIEKTKIVVVNQQDPELVALQKRALQAQERQRKAEAGAAAAVVTVGVASLFLSELEKTLR